MKLYEKKELIRAIDRYPIQYREVMLKVVNGVHAIDAVPVADIYDAGYKGKEVQFRIGGRLFAIRELAQ